MLNSARSGGYGIVGACCVSDSPLDSYVESSLTPYKYNTEGIVATVHAAEAKRSPAMILLFPWAMQYGANLLVNLAADACRSASVPVTLHMDHAQDPDIIRKAADTGNIDLGDSMTDAPIIQILCKPVCAVQDHLYSVPNLFLNRV